MKKADKLYLKALIKIYPNKSNKEIKEIFKRRYEINNKQGEIKWKNGK